jgi:hypothetical protein
MHIEFRYVVLIQLRFLNLTWELTNFYFCSLQPKFQHPTPLRASMTCPFLANFKNRARKFKDDIFVQIFFTKSVK